MKALASLMWIGTACTLYLAHLPCLLRNWCGPFWSLKLLRIGSTIGVAHRGAIGTLVHWVYRFFGPCGWRGFAAAMLRVRGVTARCFGPPVSGRALD